MKVINKNKIKQEIQKIKNKYKYSWDNEGKQILLDDNKITITDEEKKILEILLIQEMPDDMHKNLWMICSGTRLLMKENKDYYLTLLKFYESLENDNHYFYKYLTYKISHDLHRSDLKDEEVYKLKNILDAFCVRNLSLNYCQGYNLIVSHILTMNNYNEEESFYLFSKLMEDIIPFDYYLFSIGIESEINLVKILLKKYDFELYNHLDALNGLCYLDSKLQMWIFSLMLFKTDIKIKNLFFDIIFFYSINNNYNNFISILYTMIFSIITILRNNLLNCDKPDNIGTIIDEFVDKPISQDDYMQLVYYNLISQDKNKFNNNSIFELRNNQIEEISNLKTISYKNEENKESIPCNKNFPLCINEKEEKPIEKYIVYKSENNLNEYIIEDYYYGNGRKENEEKNKNEENKNEDKKNEDKISEDKESNENKINFNFENLIIERRKHFCKLNK
jgi:hypothetical protein